MQKYTEQINKLENPTFQKIRKIAIESISHLGKEERDQLWDQLNRGVALLDTSESLSLYLDAFGNMHQAKLLNAYNKLPNDLICKPFEVIDWGCGQAMGTINLLDFLHKKGCQENIRKVTLIEPSKAALERGELHTLAYVRDNVEVILINDFFENVSSEKLINQSHYPQVHLFSNILDVAQINLKHLSKLIDATVIADSYLICVGPLNPTNARIDSFLRYFDEELMGKLYEYDSYNFKEGFMSSSKTCKIRMYKLEQNFEGHLIPIEYFPTVQFQAAYELDIIGALRKSKALNFDEQITHFEVAAPFDLGASVYDDVHPILAVVNNIITRGLPTKASVFIEEKIAEAFKLTKRTISYGEIKFLPYGNVKLTELDQLFHSNLDNFGDVSPEEVQKLQLLLTPVAVARFQKVLLEAIITDKLSIEKKQWKVLVEEGDVPFAALAIKDLENLFQNITQLSEEYQHIKLPEIELTVIGNKYFVDSPLHLGLDVHTEIVKAIQKPIYDLVVTQSVLKSVSETIEAFSKFKCENTCYFNIRTITAQRTERFIYTSDRIRYKSLVEKDTKGNYKEIEESKSNLTYFLQLLFRKESFRPGQLPILDRALKNQPVIGLLPTGGGKSLTYQIAALLQPGVTLIIDPLKSLMKDQYDGLINNGIDSAAYINGSQSIQEKQHREKQLESSQLLFAFLSPERLTIASFRERLKKMHDHNVYFSYGVIDEVHCVSEWGHDFRFSYLHLGRNLYNYVKTKTEKISLFGLTATASFDVLADVERELSGNGAFDLDADVIIRYENTNRLELQYKIEKVNVSYEDEYEALKNSEYSTPEKLKKIHENYKLLIEDGFSLPVKIGNKSGFYKAKKEFLQNYIQIIPSLLNEIQTKPLIDNIKKAFIERQAIDTSIDADLMVEVEQEFYLQKEQYKHAGIVFCPHKKNTDISVINNRDNLVALIPHVGTYSGSDDEIVDSDEISMQNMELFLSNKQPLMIATKAFGMGIDKPNVRFTINMNYSSSLEGFVQEAGRAGRDRKMSLSVIFLSDYKLARINKSLYQRIPVLDKIKGKWFEYDELLKIIKHYKINAEEKHIDFLTPEQDLIRLFCKDGDNPKYFSFNNCEYHKCLSFLTCKLRKVPEEAEGWIYKKDLDEILNRKAIKINPKYIECQNSDYETVMYFYNNNFKGELVERHAMLQILNEKDIAVCIKADDLTDSEIKPQTVKGFLSTLLKAEIGQRVVSYIDYNNQITIDGNIIDQADIAKAIYRMTCIELVEDFTQDFQKKQYRIVTARKKTGEYYNGLKSFLLRYYSKNRADEELKSVYNIKLNLKKDSELEQEILQCLSYLTTFVYEKISIKRKRAIDDMRAFCIEGLNEKDTWIVANEKLKDFLYYYFNSKYAKSGYVADNDEPFSLVDDTDGGKESDIFILFKYIRVIDNDIVGVGTPLDNVKHLYGAVRLISRSLTDSSPSLSLLKSFCLFYLGTKDNQNLKNELVASYMDGMVEFENRIKESFEFWDLFEKYNAIIGQFADKKQLSHLKKEVMLSIHGNKLKNITNLYLQ